jgi:hypothetical protein
VGVSVCLQRDGHVHNPDLSRPETLQEHVRRGGGRGVPGSEAACNEVCACALPRHPKTHISTSAPSAHDLIVISLVQEAISLP